MIAWKLQEKFVDKVLKGNSVFWDHNSETGEVAFGDGFHFFVVSDERMFIDLPKLQKSCSNLNKVSLLNSFHKMDLNTYTTFTLFSMARDKGVIHKFETANNEEVWIGEGYLKEINWFKNKEYWMISAAEKAAGKSPVLFRIDEDDLKAVILPVRVGDENGI